MTQQQEAKRRHFGTTWPEVTRVWGWPQQAEKSECITLALLAV